MIPLRLTVKNFMCYRDNVPTLDLEGIHVACLCGDNGHGKTALLDAITWVLWGQARARTQDELVHQGQQDMAVELEFMARDQRYRVSRRHSRSARSRQGTTILELQVTSGDGTRPITGNSVRDTEARIREILHMDYDTFTNTAFLLQGRADLFTRGTPARRKECLAEVLDLSYYQGLEARSRERSRSIQDGVRDAESAIAAHQQEVERRPEYQEQLASATALLDQIAPEAEAQRVLVLELGRDVDTLQAGRRELRDLSGRLGSQQEDIAQLVQQVHGHEARVKEVEQILEREREIREQHATLAQSRERLDRMDLALTRKSELDREMAGLERELAVRRERLEGQAAQLTRRIEQDLAPSSSRLTEIEESLVAVANEQRRLAGLEDTIAGQREQAESVAAEDRDLRLDNERLLAEMEDTRKKFDMLQKGDTICPLCNQPLGSEGQDHLRREYEVRGRESKTQFQWNDSGLDALGRKHKLLVVRGQSLAAELSKGRQKSEGDAARLDRDLEESKRALALLGPARKELEEVRALLRTGDFAGNDKQVLSRLKADVSALGYDASVHQQARDKARDLEAYDGLHSRLAEAIKSGPAQRESLEAAREMLGRRQQEVKDAQQRKADLEAEQKRLPLLETQLGEAETRLRKLAKQRDEAQVQQGVMKRQIERCDSLAREIAQQERKRKRMLEDRSIYDELTVAFGTNGIQALIIETAIPQLEADANELLGRLTESRMFLKLQLKEGRRDSRTGTRSEELGIKIADEVGTRSYETFSGGEKFRVDFALRIALSKLLARRSGAPLPILFIDEGFGSQDRAGQERLTEAIQSVQDDFQKIIVITHIEQVKEAFPVRIEVTKTEAGSTFQIV